MLVLGTENKEMIHMTHRIVDYKRNASDDRLLDKNTDAKKMRISNEK